MKESDVLFINEASPGPPLSGNHGVNVSCRTLKRQGVASTLCDPLKVCSYDHSTASDDSSCPAQTWNSCFVTCRKQPSNDVQDNVRY